MSAYCCPAWARAWLSAPRFSSCRAAAAPHSVTSAWKALAAVPVQEPWSSVSWAWRLLVSARMRSIVPLAAADRAMTASLSTWNVATGSFFPVGVGRRAGKVRCATWFHVPASGARGDNPLLLALGEEWKRYAEGGATAGGVEHFDG